MGLIPPLDGDPLEKSGQNTLWEQRVLTTFGGAERAAPRRVRRRRAAGITGITLTWT
jgi:hypothetical protein